MTETAETRWESHYEAGRRLFRQGDHAAAEREFIAAVREANSLGGDDPRLASSLAGVAQIKYLQRDADQAEALFKRALSIRERCLGEKHPDVAATLSSLARLYFRRSDFAAAAPLLMRLLSIKQEALGAHHPEVAVILTSLAKVRLAERQYEDAEQLARRALLIREEIHQPDDPAVAVSLGTLADVLAARGLLEEEQRLRRRIDAIRGAESGRGASAETGEAGAQREPSTPVPRPSPIGPPPAAASSSAHTSSSPAPATSRTSAAAARATPRFAAQYAPSATRAPARPAPKAGAEPVARKVARPILEQGGATREPLRERKREPKREPQRSRRRRSPLGLVLAAVLVIGGAAGAWVYFSGDQIVSSAGAALEPSSLDASSEPPTASAPARGALTASPDPSYRNDPPRRQRPPAAAYSDDPPANVDRVPDRSGPTASLPVTSPLGDTAGALDRSSPVLARVDVDRITSAIGESARARADSLGSKTITVKPPVFDKPY